MLSGRPLTHSDNTNDILSRRSCTETAEKEKPACASAAELYTANNVSHAASVLLQAHSIWASIDVPPSARVATAPTPLQQFVLINPAARRQAPAPPAPARPSRKWKRRNASKRKNPKPRPITEPHRAPPATGPGAQQPPPGALVAAMAQYGIPAGFAVFACWKCIVSRPIRLLTCESDPLPEQWTCAYCMDPEVARVDEGTQVRWCYKGKHETRREEHVVALEDGVAVEMPHCEGCMQKGLEMKMGRTMSELALEKMRRGILDEKESRLVTERTEGFLDTLKAVRAEGFRSLVGPLREPFVKKGTDEWDDWLELLEKSGWVGWDVWRRATGDYFVVEGNGGRGMNGRMIKGANSNTAAEG
ncbi:hypothetical protein MPH_04064 [Macrophomina phaseolina MS6]|uniref:Uncharacterized protein n=1 Tax=Macrophomina phaseolina (strain MS6) TaxID=1126212 RepID=K2R8E6_MACPH|nr:hypothetical protein MPH_04064 [Macrophomina phaseolina MS6]